jgi:hypothetical protein
MVAGLWLLVAGRERRWVKRLLRKAEHRTSNIELPTLNDGSRIQCVQFEVGSWTFDVQLAAGAVPLIRTSERMGSGKLPGAF